MHRLPLCQLGSSVRRGTQRRCQRQGPFRWVTSIQLSEMPLTSWNEVSHEVKSVSFAAFLSGWGSCPAFRNVRDKKQA